jgi:hypothetical protein
MDPEVAERARGVFDALAVRGRPFEDIQASDFADWRMFFRFVKDASADPTTALGELNATSFLGKHDISVSAWGKSVKERSPLFKEEFDKFMRIERVREALAADLGVETPPRRRGESRKRRRRRPVARVSNDACLIPRFPRFPRAHLRGASRRRREARRRRTVTATRRLETARMRRVFETQTSPPEETARC